MADLSNLIYVTALSEPRQGGDSAEPPVQRRRPPRQAGSAGRLAPLLSILALSLVLIAVSALAEHAPATHAPSPGLVVGTAHMSHSLSAGAALRGYLSGWVSRERLTGRGG